MKKELLLFALAGLLLAGCSDTTEKQETSSEDTMVYERETAASDSLAIEIEKSSDEVDSLLNEL